MRNLGRNAGRGVLHSLWMKYHTQMNQSPSVKCKLIVPSNLSPAIDDTLEGFAQACNQILAVAKREKCWNTTKLHH